MQNNTFCYDLPIAVGNKTLCGLAEKWIPRFDHATLIGITLTPVLIYWLVLFLMTKQLYKNSFLMLTHEKILNHIEVCDADESIFNDEISRAFLRAGVKLLLLALMYH